MDLAQHSPETKTCIAKGASELPVRDTWKSAKVTCPYPSPAKSSTCKTGEIMPYIALSEDLPGISAGFAFRPETAKPMRELAHILLHGRNSLTPGERELIA